MSSQVFWIDEERIKKALHHLSEASELLNRLSDLDDSTANCILNLDMIITYLSDQLEDE